MDFSSSLLLLYCWERERDNFFCVGWCRNKEQYGIYSKESKEENQMGKYKRKTSAIKTKAFKQCTVWLTKISILYTTRIESNTWNTNIYSLFSFWADVWNLYYCMLFEILNLGRFASNINIQQWTIDQFVLIDDAYIAQCTVQCAHSAIFNHSALNFKWNRNSPYCDNISIGLLFKHIFQVFVLHILIKFWIFTSV